MKIYRLVSTGRKRVVESPFCLCGERVAAFYLEETALKIARALRESKWKTVYGCYAQPDGTFLIGPASALPVGKYGQTLALREVKGALDPSVSDWKNVTVRRIVGELDAFVRSCLIPRHPVPQERSAQCSVGTEAAEALCSQALCF